MRSVWDAEQEKWYFSIIDVLEVLIENNRPRKYWGDLKTKLKEEGNKILREAAIELGYVTNEQFDAWVCREDMIGSLK